MVSRIKDVGTYKQILTKGVTITKRRDLYLGKKCKVNTNLDQVLCLPAKKIEMGDWIGFVLDETTNRPTFLIRVDKFWNPTSLNDDYKIKNPNKFCGIFALGSQALNLILIQFEVIKEMIKSSQRNINIIKVVNVKKMIKKIVLKYTMGYLENLGILILRTSNGDIDHLFFIT